MDTEIDIMRRVDIFYTACRMVTQNVTPTLPGFQDLNCCIQYLDNQPHKPILYPSNYYYGSNVIRLTSSGTHVEHYTTQNALE